MSSSKIPSVSTSPGAEIRDFFVSEKTRHFTSNILCNKNNKDPSNKQLIKN